MSFKRISHGFFGDWRGSHPPAEFSSRGGIILSVVSPVSFCLEGNPTLCIAFDFNILHDLWGGYTPARKFDVSAMSDRCESKYRKTDRIRMPRSSQGIQRWCTIPVNDADSF